MTDALTNDEQTAFAKAWQAFKHAHTNCLEYGTLTNGPYLENRLHIAFTEGWNSSAKECMQVLKVTV